MFVFYLKRPFLNFLFLNMKNTNNHLFLKIFSIFFLMNIFIYFLKKEISNEHLVLLGGDYPGIQMNGLPKGFRSEASVAITIAERV